jgi:hypothetical protein
MRRFASAHVPLASIALLFGQQGNVRNSALILNLQSTKAPSSRKGIGVGAKTVCEFLCAKLVSKELWLYHRKANIPILCRSHCNKMQQQMLRERHSAGLG